MFKIYNTYSKTIEEFKPKIKNEVSMYCCGPTVYNYQHIGNFRTFINEDILSRTLKYLGYKVTHVMNITDVGHLASDADDGEDKMLLAAKKENKKSFEIADYYTKIFFDDWKKLNLLVPDVVCKATDHIKEMINLAKELEEKGFAYFANGNVYFDTAKFEKYGELANLKLDNQISGARVDIDPHKKNQNDFVLWFTKSKFENHELLWESPWGLGYPGWHIECSAMSMKYLGNEFDIHCGGIDHIPVHHTNEIAQSEAITGKQWVRYWVHSEFALINNEKISKSKNNFIILTDLINNGYEPQAFRMLILGTHYRKHLAFTSESMDNAMRNWVKLKNSIIKFKENSQSLSENINEYENEFNSAIANDLNMPLALASVWKVINSDLSNGTKLKLLYKFDSVLGLDLENIQTEILDIPLEITNLLEERKIARENKNWSESDRLRDLILSKGYELEDGKQGQQVKKKI